MRNAAFADEEDIRLKDGLRISDERLLELSSRIRPVVRIDGRLRFFGNVDLRRSAFISCPVLPEGPENPREIGRIRTYHMYSMYSLQKAFVPTVAEVLAQIPQEYAARVTAFEIVKFRGYSKGRGLHVADTKLYA